MLAKKALSNDSEATSDDFTRDNNSDINCDITVKLSSVVSHSIFERSVTMLALRVGVEVALTTHH